MAKLAGKPAPPVHGSGGHAPKNPITAKLGPVKKQPMTKGPASPTGQQAAAAGQQFGSSQKLYNSLMAAKNGGAQPKAQAPNPLGPYQNLIETPKQMEQQAAQAASSIYQPILNNLNQQSQTATGLAAKRASDYQNFMTWAAGQQASMMTQAAAQDQQYNNLMTQISGAQNMGEAAAAATGTQPGAVSDMANSTAFGTIAANQGAMNNSTTGALQSAAANMANNQSQQNAWGSMSMATAANMQQQDNADYNNSMNTINANLASAQSSQAQAQQTMLSSLQSQNATNVKNATDYEQQQWANKNTLQQQALSQANTVAAAKEGAREFNVGVKQKEFEDQQSAQQWAADYKQKATEDSVQQGQTDMSNLQATFAEQGGTMTYAQANQYNQAFAMANPGTVPTVLKPPKGKSMNSVYVVGEDAKNDAANREHVRMEDQQKAYEDVTSRLRVNAQNRSDADAAKAKLLQEKINMIAQGQKGALTKAEINYYASETGEKTAEAKSDLIKAIAYARGQSQSGTSSSTKSGSSAGSGTSATPQMTPDEQTSYFKDVSTWQNQITTALSSRAAYTKFTGHPPVKGQSLQAGIRNYLVSYGKGNAQVWAAFDEAVGGGLSPRTRQLLIAKGISPSYLKTAYPKTTGKGGVAKAPKGKKFTPKQAMNAGKKAFGGPTSIGG